MKKLNLHSKKVSANYVSWNRSWVTVKRHLPIIAKPLISALVVAFFWLFVVQPRNIHFGEHSAEPVLFIVLPLIGFMYVIFASVAVGSVFEQYKIISKCVVRKDVDTFLLYRDEQLPIIMHILVSAPSVFLIAFVSLFDYHGEILTGFSTVFAVTFMLVLVWVIATELDDFGKSIWFREKIPSSWYEIDIEKHFSQTKK